jgi:hypothetical protein
MNYTPSDKFLCDCCAIYDGTTIFQLDTIEYILTNISKDVNLEPLNNWTYTCPTDVNALVDLKYSPVWLYKDTVYSDINIHYNQFVTIISSQGLNVNTKFLTSLCELIKFKIFFGCIEKRYCPYKFLATIPDGIAKEHTYLDFDDTYAPHIEAVCKIIREKGTVSCGECSKYIEAEYIKENRLEPSKYPVSNVFGNYVELIYKCY